MKIKFLGLLSALCLLMGACNDDDPAVQVLRDNFLNLSYEGTLCEADLLTQAEWTVTSSASWCKPLKGHGLRNGTLQVQVDANLGEAREAEVLVTANGETQKIRFSQEAKPEGEELVYRLPIIFHVLYFDESDKNQNVPAEKIYEMIDKTNELYRNALGVNSVDMKLEFVPATHDPRGNLLAEPGIERVQWVSSTLNPVDVMNDRSRKYVHLQWDPNDYVNILLYKFSASGSGILGISTFPLTPKNHPLEGLVQVEDKDYGLDNLIEYRGLSINSTYVMDTSDYLSPIAPKEWKPFIDMQNEGYITLAHELGHYLGLRHTFSESGWYCSDTDLCKDTPSYDYDDYTAWMLDVYDKAASDPDYEVDWAALFSRQTCKNEPFVSRNIMDYAYSYVDEFTPQQRERVRHVLTYSPLIAGPKVKPEAPAETRTVSGLVDLPHTLMDVEPRPLLMPRK